MELITLRMENTDLDLNDWAGVWQIRIGQMTGSGIGFDTGPYESYAMSKPLMEGMSKVMKKKILVSRPHAHYV